MSRSRRRQAAPARQTVRMRVTLAHVVYRGGDGWAVCRTTADDGAHVTAVGQWPELRPGAYYDLAGSWEDARRHGRQLRVATALLAMPVDAVALARYLASAHIEGLGDVTAHRIGQACPADMAPGDWLDPAAPPEVDGVRPHLVQAAADALARDREQTAAELAIRELLRDLPGVGDRRIKAMIDRWGPRAAAIVRETPYELLSIDGLGWQIVDGIARERCGVALDDAARIRAGLVHVLREAMSEGHTGLPLRELRRTARELLGVAVPTAADMPADVTVDRGLAYLALVHRWEAAVGERVGMLLDMPPVSIPAAGDEAHLDLSQRAALDRIAGARIALLTGGPGTGKTTTIRALLARLAAAGQSAQLAAPTGKAARRMTEQTGRDARTIHSALSWQPGAQPLATWGPVDVVVIDEASMIDLEAMHHVLDTMSSSQRLILVGDPGQLAPVGAGQPFHDLVAGGQVARGHLEQVHRQQGGHLLDLIHAIGRGDRESVEAMVERDDRDSDVRVLRQDDAGTILRWLRGLCGPSDPLAARGYAEADWQIVSPTNTRGPISCEAVCLALQERLREAPPTAAQMAADGWRGEEPPRFRRADRIVVTANGELPLIDDSGTVRVVNGQQGTVTAVDLRTGRMALDLDGMLVSMPLRGSDCTARLAYCVTVHRAQGSEWPVVILPLHRTMPDHMLTRQWVYTAASRAAGLLVLVGRPELLAAACTRPTPPRHGRLLARIDGSRQ